jgi:RimJ/RimL family protein N-acetyltransferase
VLVQLETERLLLRVPEEPDVDAWTEMYAQPAVERWLTARSREQVADYIREIRERHAADGFGILAAVRKEDERVIGRAGILVWDDRTWMPTTLRDAGEHGEVEIGWALHPDVWGRGYATEASVVCRDYVLERVRPRVIALIVPENVRSIAVAERLGLAHERDVLLKGEKPARVYAVERKRP